MEDKKDNTIPCHQAKRVQYPVHILLANCHQMVKYHVIYGIRVKFVPSDTIKVQMYSGCGMNAQAHLAAATTSRMV